MSVKGTLATLKPGHQLIQHHLYHDIRHFCASVTGVLQKNWFIYVNILSTFSLLTIGNKWNFVQQRRFQLLRFMVQHDRICYSMVTTKLNQKSHPNQQGWFVIKSAVHVVTCWMLRHKVVKHVYLRSRFRTVFQNIYVENIRRKQICNERCNKKQMNTVTMSVYFTQILYMCIISSLLNSIEDIRNLIQFTFQTFHKVTYNEPMIYSSLVYMMGYHIWGKLERVIRIASMGNRSTENFNNYKIVRKVRMK